MNDLCTQKTKGGLCGKPAVAMMHWPGKKSLPVCQEHREWAQRIADALGFFLTFTEIEYEDKWKRENDALDRDRRIHALFPKVLELAKAGYELSKYAACSKRDNTEEFLSGLFQHVQEYQYRYEALKLDEVQP